MVFKMKNGFTLIEILITLSILVILSTIVLSTFRLFDEKEALSKDFFMIISTLEKARNQTLFSKDSSSYGVHFETNQVVLFKGETYSSSDPENVVNKLHSKVIISNISLEGAVSDVVFERLSGKTDQNGSVTITSKIDATNSKTINILKTGLTK